MDRTIHERVWALSTKQEPYPSNLTPIVLNPGTEQPFTLHSDSHRPHHQLAQELRFQQHPDHYRPQVLMSSCLPAMPQNDNRTPNCPTLLPTCVPLVQITLKNHHRLRPSIYVTFQLCPSQGARHCLELLHSLSPPD
jgi:hypothetical protein